MLEQQNEAFYHFTLSNMVDLIDAYGYCNVINDLDDMITERANNLVLTEEQFNSIVRESV